jgi:hypothetical protein
MGTQWIGGFIFFHGGQFSLTTGMAASAGVWN